MFRLPRYIENAFYTVYFESANEEKYEAFASRWKGIDLQALRRALLGGRREDRLIALLALGSWLFRACTRTRGHCSILAE